MAFSLTHISTSEQSGNILKAWWGRPKKINDLKSKFPNEAERIKELHYSASMRKHNALQIDAYFKSSEPSQKEPVTLKLSF